MLDETIHALIILGGILVMLCFAGLLEELLERLLMRIKKKEAHPMGTLYETNFSHAQHVHDMAQPRDETPVYYSRCNKCGGRIYTGDDVYRLDDHIYCEDCVRGGREIAG